MCCGKEFHQLGSGLGSSPRYSVLDKLEEMSRWKSLYAQREEKPKIYLLEGDRIVGELDRDELKDVYYPSGKDYLSLSEAMSIAQSDRSGGATITYSPRKKQYISGRREAGDPSTSGTFSGNNLEQVEHCLTLKYFVLQ